MADAGTIDREELARLLNVSTRTVAKRMAEIELADHSVIVRQGSGQASTLYDRQRAVNAWRTATRPTGRPSVLEGLSVQQSESFWELCRDGATFETLHSWLRRRRVEVSRRTLRRLIETALK